MKEEAVRFLENLKEKVKIISHKDTDGLCALAILLNYLEKKGIDEEHELLEAYIENLDTLDNMIFIDISLDNVSKFVTDNTLVIDHHPYTKKMDKVCFYNPREKDPKAYIPAAYLIYEIISEIENIDEMKWIAAVGIMGDRGDLNSKFCKDFVESVEDKEKLEMISRYIFSSDLIDHTEGMEKALQIVRKAKSPDEVLENTYLKYCYEEIQRKLVESKRKVEREGNILFVEVNSRYNIKSIIASQILEKEEGVIVIAYSSRDDYYHISGRTNTSTDLGKIFKKTANICGGMGGGHEKAAGARINKNKIELFKEEVISGVEEN